MTARISPPPSARAPIRAAVLACSVASALACSQPPPPPAESSAESPAESPAAAHAGIDSLNVRLARAYRAHDPAAYGALYTDSAVFEWPAFNTVRGPAALAGMARANWAALRDMDLRLTVAARRLAPGHATEFGAFEQSYSDASGARSTEFGRYVALLVRQADGSWRLDRFFGFADSTRKAPPAPARP